MSLISDLKNQGWFTEPGVDGISGYSIAVASSRPHILMDYLECLANRECVDILEIWTKRRVEFSNGTVLKGYVRAEELTRRKFDVMIVDDETDGYLRRTVICNTINGQEYFIDLAEDVKKYEEERRLANESNMC